PRSHAAPGKGRARPERTGIVVPVSRSQAAKPRKRHRDAGGRRRKRQPGPERTDARQSAQIGARLADETAPRRAIRGKRPDLDRIAPDRRKPLQKPDRGLSFAHPLPGNQEPRARLVTIRKIYYFSIFPLPMKGRVVRIYTVARHIYFSTRRPIDVNQLFCEVPASGL